MSQEDFNELRADAKSEGFDDHDARQIANGRILKLEFEHEEPDSEECLQREMIRAMDMIFDAIKPEI